VRRIYLSKQWTNKARIRRRK